MIMRISISTGFAVKQHHDIPVLMLAFGLVITLGSVVIGSAIMLLGKEDRGGGTAFRLPEVDKVSALQPVRVTTRSQE
ncbi:MAG: hypothetical protein NXI02_23645, partial [Rhodobacteraceae bacterium]|nr:hypothetical protein [Paracoccaceae bacterium]